MYSNGVKTQRDAWFYDRSSSNVSSKIKFFINVYEQKSRTLNAKEWNDSDLGQDIKWYYDLKRLLNRNIRIRYSARFMVDSLYRPFTNKKLYFSDELNGRRYQMPRIFPLGIKKRNRIISIKGPTADCFVALGADRIVDVKYTETGNGPSYCFPFYHYTEDAERINNITDWALDRFNENYSRTGDLMITAEDIFAYSYAVLHDPVYREKYRIDLQREFPRLPFYEDFDWWAGQGRELLDLHIGFECAELYGLQRVDNARSKSVRPMLRANADDKERGEIRIDSWTTLKGVPSDAWRYRLGSRSALEWVLDQHKEKKPRDKTIQEEFNTYRFADYKEDVIDLLQRVCTVSVRTMAS